MKTSLFLLSLAMAMVAVSNAAVLTSSMAARFAMIVGNIGPEDKLLTTMTSQHEPYPGSVLHWVEIGFSMPTVLLNIAYIQILERRNSGARAEIRDGGVGSDRLLIRFTPHEQRAFHFDCEVHGSYTEYGRSGAVPEIITYEERHTSASE